MTLADRLAANGTPMRGLPCPIATIITQMSDADRRTLLDALDTPPHSPERISAAMLSKALTEEGYTVHFKGIERHRTRTCRCFTGSGK